MHTSNNNVINFPQNKIVRVNKDLDDEKIDNNMLSMKLNHINETLSVVLPLVFNNIEMAGFILSQPTEDVNDINMKDGTMIVESIRSLLCKYYDLYHPFQEISEVIFDEKNDYDIVESINIKFTSNVYDKNEED